MGGAVTGGGDEVERSIDLRIIDLSGELRSQEDGGVGGERQGRCCCFVCLWAIGRGLGWAGWAYRGWLQSILNNVVGTAAVSCIKTDRTWGNRQAVIKSRQDEVLKSERKSAIACCAGRGSGISDAEVSIQISWRAASLRLLLYSSLLSWQLNS
jgi:hypothetical protein